MSSRRHAKAADNEIWFPHGLVGLPGLTQFSIHRVELDGPFSILQSEERDAMRFPLIDPLLIRPDYEVILSPEELCELGVGERRDLAVYAMLHVPSDASGITVNLRAPILVSSTKRIGMQIIPKSNSFSVTASLAHELRREEAEVLL